MDRRKYTILFEYTWYIIIRYLLVLFFPPSTVYGSIQPRTNCPTSCGNMSIPFPFGTELGCFAKLHLYLTCTPGTTVLPPVLKLTDQALVTDISIDDGILQVHEASGPGDFMARWNLDPALYTSSGQWGAVKWVIDNMTCQHAMNNSDYRCFSTHSDCVDVTEDRTLKHVGYRCRCSSGFEGNPYIQDGCTGILPRNHLVFA